MDTREQIPGTEPQSTKPYQNMVLFGREQVPGVLMAWVICIISPSVPK